MQNLVKQFSDTKNGANPGLVFLENNISSKKFKEFSKLALWQLVHRKKAKKFLVENNLDSFYLGNGQGLIGAIGAIGYEFNDHTMELLSYRRRSQFGKNRRISSENVKQMHNKTFPKTFNSYDIKKKRVLITPHGPDPVFYGIRGEDSKSLFSASKVIQPSEKLDGYMLFKSNQGTSDHLQNKIDVIQLQPYSSGTITGFVSREPQILKGGHVLFSVNVDGIHVNCAIYKPTGLTNTLLNLIKGDKVKIGGGVRKASKKHSRVINVEYLKVLRLEKNFSLVNPFCHKCSKKMKSKGKKQGFECVKCGKKSNSKKLLKIPRKIKKGLYIPIISAHRHLTRPIQRMGISNKDAKFDNSIPWVCKFN